MAWQSKAWAWPYSYTLTSPESSHLAHRRIPASTAWSEAHLDNRPFWPGSTTRDGTAHGVAQFAGDDVGGPTSASTSHHHGSRNSLPPKPAPKQGTDTPQNHPTLQKMTAEPGPLFMTCTSLEFSRCLSRSTRNRKKGKPPIVTNARPLEKTERRHHPPSA